MPPTDLTFTQRQEQVIRLLATGNTYAEIGETLGISSRTVKQHADYLRMKLRVRAAREIPTAFYYETGRSPWPA